MIQAETGGAFGGKEDFPSVIGSHAALLAMKSGRPVKICYDRAEDLAATTKRHPSRTRHRTAVSADGKLLAGEIDFAIDGGAYARSLARRAFTRHDSCSRAVSTGPPPRPRQGHGDQRPAARRLSAASARRRACSRWSGTWTKIAKVVGLSPGELRRRNFLHHGR